MIEPCRGWESRRLGDEDFRLLGLEPTRSPFPVSCFAVTYQTARLLRFLTSKASPDLSILCHPFPSVVEPWLLAVRLPHLNELHHKFARDDSWAWKDSSCSIEIALTSSARGIAECGSCRKVSRLVEQSRAKICLRLASSTTIPYLLPSYNSSFLDHACFCLYLFRTSRSPPLSSFDCVAPACLKAAVLGMRHLRGDDLTTVEQL